MIELTKDKKHIVIKRDGREEPFSWEKLKKVLMWATGNKEVYVNNILENIELKIRDRIKITELYDELIRTVSNMISPLYPIYDSIAEKLYTMKIYKETCGLKKSGEYPHLQSFLNKGIKYKIYDKKIIDSFSKEDIDYLNNCLVPDRDFLYTFKGIVLMFDKYCKRYKKKQFELPQITYMVAAMYSFYDDYLKHGSKKAIKKSRKLRLSLIKKNYDLLSKFEITYATPRLSNSMKIRSQLASCILNTPDDDTWSLNHTDGNMAVYSKFSGGIAYDASWIRASGSLISSNSGVSDGPAPFIKRTEQTISSFNQQGCIHEDSYVEVLESVIINDGTLVPLRKIKKDYDNKNVILNQDLLDFINSNLKEFKLEKGFISKEDFKNIWIRKIKGETKKNIIKDYPCLSTTTFKKYISKYIRSLDKSSLKGFKIYKDYPYLAIHKDQTVIQIADLVLSKKQYTHKGYITVPTGKTTVLLHRMMYSTFVGDIPNNLTVDHIDNNKDNNDISNLNLLTSEENTKKQRLDGVIKKASDKLRVVNFLKYGKKINGYRTSNIIEIIKYNTILVPIKKVKVNDLVKSMNTNTGEIEYKLVEKVHFFDIPLERQYELVFGDTNITTSDHHPIFYKDIDGKIKYKRTDNMVIGDIGIDSNAKNKKLTAINRPHNSVKFADLTVKDNNNYFAKSFNSKGNCILVHNTRKGSCVVTFPWWHLDVLDFIMLKDAGGTEDTRARKLMYAIRISNLFRKRVAKDEYITLFDPKETPLLNETFDTFFDKNYLMYEQKAGIRKKRIKAKDLLFNLLKVRQETGNLYLTFVDNINKQNMRNVFVGASNLCQEIVVPSSPSKLISEKIYKSENNSYEIHRVIKSGEIGICNLLSINLMAWTKYTDKEKYETMYSILRGCDNIIDTQFYPAKEGEVSNKKNRPIGIGVTNYANLLASNKLKYTDEETKQFTFDVFEDLYYYVYLVSNKLAKERGTYETFKHDKWAQGLTPVHISMFNYKKFGLTFKNKKRWDKLGEDIKNLGGVRFSLHSAIAPTACQTLETEIRYKNESILFEDYLKKNGIKVYDIMSKGKQGWFEFTNPDTIDTRYGEKEVYRVWYNGKYDRSISLYFENDCKPYTFTQNHMLLSVDKGWKQVKDFKKGDFVVDETQSNKMRKIINVKVNFDVRDTWDIEVPDIHEYLLGNGVVTHNTSGKTAGMTESIEPIVGLFFTEEGSYTLPALVPNLKENREYYQRCWDIPARTIIELAAIRQMFIDQSQSLNLYYKKPESAKELWLDIVYAMDLGLKTLYYMKTPKSNFELEEVCESCT